MSARKGNAAENLVATYLEDRGWTVGGRRHRRGGGDLLAVRPEAVGEGRYEVRLVEVKATKGPWAFAPKERAELLTTAERLRAEALLAWVSKGRVKLIPSKDWPT